jgi:integrase
LIVMEREHGPRGRHPEEVRPEVPQARHQPGEYRDVPVPWLWEKVRDLPGGPLCPGNGDRPYRLYGSVERQVRTHAAGAGIPAGFRPHSLRHAFASVMLARGIPITDVAQWLGHKDINETYRT